MRPAQALLCCCLSGLAAVPAGAQDIAGRIVAARWQEEAVAVGVTLRRGWFGDLAAGPQSLAWLEIDPRAEGTALRVAVPARLTATTAQAAAASALAAVNGGFFEQDGRPRGLRRTAGWDLGAPWSRPQAAVGFGPGLTVRYGREDDDWSAWPEMVAAGPRLLADGRIVDQGERQRALVHPRTALGTRADGTAVLLCADGRTPYARGLSLEDLAAVMAALGCRDALNLDGGGSSTLFVRSFGEGGIRNHPCDDRIFGPGGERAVADVVLLDARAVVVVDDAEAVVEGQVEMLADGDGMVGGWCRYAADGGGVTARFVLRARRPGPHALEVRTVRAPGCGTARLRVCWGDREVEAAMTSEVAWRELALVDAGTAPIVVECRGVPGAPLVLDALRLRER